MIFAIPTNFYASVHRTPEAKNGFMLRLIKNWCQKLAYASVAENPSQKLTYLASGDKWPVPKCEPIFLFLLPHALHFSLQLYFSLLSPLSLQLVPPPSLPPRCSGHRHIAAIASSLHLHFLFPRLNFICSL